MALPPRRIPPDHGKAKNLPEGFHDDSVVLNIVK